MKLQLSSAAVVRGEPTALEIAEPFFDFTRTALRDETLAKELAHRVALLDQLGRASSADCGCAVRSSVCLVHPRFDASRASPRRSVRSERRSVRNVFLEAGFTDQLARDVPPSQRVVAATLRVLAWMTVWRHVFGRIVFALVDAWRVALATHMGPVHAKLRVEVAPLCLRRGGCAAAKAKHHRCERSVSQMLAAESHR
jgi:hypothetical protein